MLLKNWNVLLVERGFERDVARVLAELSVIEDADADVSVPIEYRMKSDKKTVIRVILLPGFVFLQESTPEFLGKALRAGDQDTGVVRVLGFLHKVGDPNAPAVITDRAMAAFFDIVDRMNLAFMSKILDGKMPKRAAKYSHPVQGNFVKIVEGLAGEIVKSEKNRSIVGIQILGRLVEASVSTRQPLEVV